MRASGSNERARTKKVIAMMTLVTVMACVHATCILTSRFIRWINGRTLTTGCKRNGGSGVKRTAELLEDRALKLDARRYA